MNAQERIANYVLLRDHKKAAADVYKKSMQRVNDAMEKLEGELLEDISNSGGTSLSGDSGTVYLRTQSSATVKDRDAFLRFVFETRNLEVMDVRASKTLVRELGQKGTVVPGVKYTELTQIGVRRGKTNDK